VDRGAGLVNIVTVFPATLSFKVTRAGDVLVFLKNNNADEELVYTAAGYLAGVRFCYARVTFAISGSKSVAVTLTQPTN
jgi:zinc transporter ZupT